MNIALMIAFFILLIATSVILELLSLRDSLSRVGYSLRLSKRSVDPGEVFTMESTVENLSRLPLTFLRVTEQLPAGAEPLALGEGYSIHAAREGFSVPTKLESTVFLRPRQRLTRRITCTLPKRGRYFWRAAEVHGGDFLGLVEKNRDFHFFSEVVVLPKRAEEIPVMTALGGLLGDVSVRRFIHPDPVLMLGFREYTGREPQKQIAWPQSLRAGKLLVKEFDHTIETAVTVLLNVSCAGRDRYAAIEATFSLARSVCEQLEKRRIQYGFLTNAMAAGAISLWTSVTEGLGEQHLLTILEGLGRATYDPAEPFHRTVERAAHMAEQGRSHILITPTRDKQTLALVQKLSKRTGGGFSVLVAEELTDESAKDGEVA